MKGIINIGILAHVDAGKTSITEHINFLSGNIRILGKVDEGSTVTDHHQIEKDRGISVKSSNINFDWKDYKINLIDTPGHADFSSEVENVLPILDIVVLVVSAVEGIQSHTFLLWETIKELNIPCIIFINKVDRIGSDFDIIKEQIKSEFNTLIWPYQSIEFEGTSNADIIPIDQNLKHLNEAIEQIAILDDQILSLFLEDEKIDNTTLNNAIRTNFHTQKLIPILAGSAKFGLGIKNILDTIISLHINNSNNTNEISGLIYKVEHDIKYGKLCHIKVYGNKIETKHKYKLNDNDEFKIIQLKQMNGIKQKDITFLDQNDVGIICGNNDLKVGDIIGQKNLIKKHVQLKKPILLVEITPIKSEHFNDLKSLCSKLIQEDPSYEFLIFKDLDMIQCKLHGALQIEILENLFHTIYNIPVTINYAGVLYKETPSSKAIGKVRYWMPKPCWAIMTFEVAPGKRGSGITYKSNVRTNKIAQKYQNEVNRTIPKALEQGLKSWEITDIEITLVDGEDHEVHSRPGDFMLATPMGIMRAIEQAGTSILEPIMSYEIKAPEIYLGKISSDLNQMRAIINSPIITNGFFTIHGLIPAETSIDYSIKLSSITSGKGRIKIRFSNYELHPNGQDKIQPYRGVNPLDESLWILHNRGAFHADKR